MTLFFTVREMLTIQSGYFGLGKENRPWLEELTLINILAGLTRATSGRAAVLGCDVRQQWRQARRQLGVVPQELAYDPFFYGS